MVCFNHYNRCFISLFLRGHGALSNCSCQFLSSWKNWKFSAKIPANRLFLVRWLPTLFICRKRGSKSLWWHWWWQRQWQTTVTVHGRLEMAVAITVQVILGLTMTMAKTVILAEALSVNAERLWVQQWGMQWQWHLTLNDWSRGEQWMLFPENPNVSLDFVSGNIEILGKQNSLFPKGSVIKWFVI